MRKIDLRAGDRVTLVMPASEVCMHMRVCGKPMDAELLSNDMAQLYSLDGPAFSAPITTGEAGIYGYQKVGYYAYTEYGAVKYTYKGVDAIFPPSSQERLELLEFGCASYGFLLNYERYRGKWLSWHLFGTIIANSSDSERAQAIAQAMKIQSQKDSLKVST